MLYHVHDPKTVVTVRTVLGVRAVLQYPNPISVLYFMVQVVSFRKRNLNVGSDLLNFRSHVLW